MIALEKDIVVIKEYYEWFEENKDELNNHFDIYSNKKYFKLNKKSFTFLEKKAVEKNIIIKLHNLTNKEFINENDFINAVKHELGENLTSIDDILKSATKTPTDWIKQKHRNKIQEFLFPTSYLKCGYCERYPNKGGGYLEIEHIVAKIKDRKEVFLIENFLPSCKQCNTVKGKKDSQNILNPYSENSFKNHLKLNLDTMKICGLSEEGKETIRILNLSINAKVFRIKKSTFNGAIIVRENIKKYIDKALSIKRKHRNNQTLECLFDELKALIELVNIEQENTSTYATYLFNNAIFKELIDFIKAKDKNKSTELNNLIKEKEKYCLSIN